MDKKLNKQKHVSNKTEPEKEFGGWVGALILVLFLPITTIYLNLACRKESCSILSLPSFPSYNELFNLTSFYIFIGWVLFQLLIHLLIPVNQTHYGLPLKNGKCLPYKCNGFWSFVVSILAFLIIHQLGVPVTFIYYNYLSFITSSLIFSLALSLLLYIKSLSLQDDLLADSCKGRSCFVYDFFLGRELNPRIGGVDLKFFFELRPGLIGWIILDLCFIMENYNTNDLINHSLLLVTFFHTLYVADSLWHEEAVLSTMDITHDGFGFMLVFGDISWVPFLYSLQTRFLLEHPNIQWSAFTLGIFFILNAIGYLIFRLSNSQKNAFRKNPKDPAVSNLKTMKTASGKELLISGWWGISRHPNYFGDLIMSLTWSLATGFSYIIPYFYPIYFLSLLIHRGIRDDIHCRKKYGQDWDRYCKLVPYKMIPYVY